MQWKVTYFNEKVYGNLMDWPNKILAKYLRIVDLMEKEGPDLGMPITRALGDGLFEIRVKAQKGIGRAFFCTVVAKEIMILHGFIKKTSYTPEKEFVLAKKRLRGLNKNAD